MTTNDFESITLVRHGNPNEEAETLILEPVLTTGWAKWEIQARVLSPEGHTKRVSTYASTPYSDEVADVMTEQAARLSDAGWQRQVTATVGTADLRELLKEIAASHIADIAHFADNSAAIERALDALSQAAQGTPYRAREAANG